MSADLHTLGAQHTAPFLLGKQAGEAGLSSFTNPYPAGTPEHEQWRQGYFDTQEAA